MSRVLITGGAGFIGSHLTDALLSRGDDVIIIDNMSTGKRSNLPNVPALEVIENDIADTAIVNNVFGYFEPDTVVHAAASYKNPDDWISDVRANVLGTVNVVKACERLDVGRLIYLQTALCYGLNPSEYPVTLNHPLRPEGSSYAFSKTVAEQYIKLSNVPSLTFRMANIYGPRNLSGPIPTFYHRLTNDLPCYVMGTRRDFVYIDDFIELLLLAIDGRGNEETYHVSGGKDYSIKEIFDLITWELWIETNVQVKERGPDDAMSIFLDPEQTNLDFGWWPVVKLNNGIESTIAWYKENPINETYTHLKIEE